MQQVSKEVRTQTSQHVHFPSQSQMKKTSLTVETCPQWFEKYNIGETELRKAGHSNESRLLKIKTTIKQPKIRESIRNNFPGKLNSDK